MKNNNRHFRNVLNLEPAFLTLLIYGFSYWIFL